jgi:hypothetical protein
MRFLILEVILAREIGIAPGHRGTLRRFPVFAFCDFSEYGLPIQNREASLVLERDFAGVKLPVA